LSHREIGGFFMLKNYIYDMYIKFSEYLREYVGDLYSTKGTIFDTPDIPKLRSLNLSARQRLTETFNFVDFIANEFGEELLSIEKSGRYMDPFLGSGSYGSVFLLKSGKVLKITSDRSEIRVIVRLVKKLTKYLINYYDVREIVDEDKSMRIYAMIMDKITPVKGDERQVCTYVENLFFMLPPDYNEKMESSIKEKLINKTELKYFRHDSGVMSTLDKYWKNFVGMVQELRRLKITEPDFNGGINFGKKEDGTIVHIDIRDIEGRDKSLPDLGFKINNLKQIDVSPILGEMSMRKRQDFLYGDEGIVLR
jgi:hypothetical protein